MAVQGPNAANVAVGAELPDPEDARADDGSYATSQSGVDGYTASLTLYDYGFSLPADATIDGIEVTIDRFSTRDEVENYVDDLTVSMMKSQPTTVGDNKAKAGNWTSGPTDPSAVQDYGGASDLWGLSWTPAEINSANFGVFFEWTIHTDDVLTVAALIDAVLVTVHYTRGADASPGTAASSSPGTVAWVNPSNALSSDDSYATATGAGDDSEQLQLTNFGFAIPAGVTIDGIQVDVERKASASEVGNRVNDDTVKLVKGGTVSGENKADLTSWATSDETNTYGGESDLWSLSWTPADINASNFGVAIAVNLQTDEPSITASIDHVIITVFYSGGSTGSGTATAILFMIGLP